MYLISDMFQVKMYDDIGETPNTPLMEEGPTAVREFIGPTRLHDSNSFNF